MQSAHFFRGGIFGNMKVPSCPCFKILCGSLAFFVLIFPMSLDRLKLGISYFNSLVLTSWILQGVPVPVQSLHWKNN
jgi:hypothetical protein